MLVFIARAPSYELPVSIDMMDVSVGLLLLIVGDSVIFNIRHSLSSFTLSFQPFVGNLARAIVITRLVQFAFLAIFLRRLFCESMSPLMFEPELILV